VEFMKAIHSKVNIVPVIAKADTLTLKERDRLKRRVSGTHMHTGTHPQTDSLPLPYTHLQQTQTNRRYKGEFIKWLRPIRVVSPIFCR
jgi:hypothetical protein